MRKGGIKKTLLLAIAMFIAGYLAAICTLNPDSLRGTDENVDYSQRFEGVTSQIKDMVKEHGAEAYSEIAEFVSSLKKDEDAEENTEK